MLDLQAPEGSPVHPSGFAPIGIQDSRLPTKPVPNAIRSSNRPIIIRLMLAGIGQLMAMTAGEDSPAVKDGHPPPTAFGNKIGGFRCCSAG